MSGPLCGPVPESAVPALLRAVDLVDGAVVGVRAATEVEWCARAAELYRVAVADVARALVQDRAVLEGALRLAYGGWAR